MRRRKRKMSSLSHSDRRPSHTEHPAASDVNCRRLLVHLCGVLLIYVSILPHLVNLTTSQTMHEGRNLSALLTATIQDGFNQNHFDDEPTRGTPNGSSSPVDSSSRMNLHQLAPPERATTGNSNKTNVISVNLQQMISPTPIVNNEYNHLQSELNSSVASRDDDQDQHLDDLLAVESHRSPALLALMQHQHQNRSNGSSIRPLATAPYEASTKDEPLSPDTRDEARPSNNQTLTESSSGSEPHNNSRMFSIQTVPTLTPIYLKHPLPSALRPQLIAFPHPASARANQSSPGTDDGQGSFALLPSWPSIYITQREHTVSSTTTARPAGTQLTDPKVPMNYPDWSRVDHHSSRSRSRGRLASSEVEYDRQQDDHLALSAGRRSNLTSTSELDESVDGHPTNRTTDWADERLLQQQQRQQQLDRSRKLLADSWTKLLHQATKNNAMESLMLTNRSIVSLLCDTNNMLVKFKFKRPFYGLVETNLDPFKQCRVFGDGSHYYEMRIDLFECGTRQEMSRLFINNIQIKFQADKSDYQRQLTQRQQSIQSQDDAPRFEPEDVDEFKTLICSYPPPNSHAQAPATSLRESTLPPDFRTSSDSRPHSEPSPFDNLGRKTFAGGRTEDDATSTNNNGDSINLSERIIDNPADDSSSALYYEPILVISGLLLLLLAIALALVSSAYIARRKQRAAGTPPPPSQAAARRAHSASPYSTNSNTSRGNRLDSLRFYGLSPAQLANREATPQPVAPPLIGVKTTTTGGSHKHRTTGRVPKVSSREGTLTSPSVLKHKQKLLRKSSRERPTTSKRIGSSSPPLPKRPISSQAHPAPRNAISSEQSNGSSSDKSSPSEISVTTIEIPYVNSKLDQTNAQAQQERANASNLIRNVSSQTPTKLERDAKSQTAPLEPPPPPPPPVVTEEIKRETSHERIVERMSYEVLGSPRPPTAKSESGPVAAAKQPPAKEQEPVKRQSPVPFGSFRSKLTSPVEFRRLQNIVRLFNDDQPIPNTADLYKSYRSKILRTISLNERRELKRLLTEDEAFRSNVVDSTDSETFKRKLRDNPKYASRILSKATWDLLEEVLLDAGMSKQANFANIESPRPAAGPSNYKMPTNSAKVERITTARTTEAPKESRQPYERTVKIELPTEEASPRPLLVTRSIQRDKSSSLVVERAQPETNIVVPQREKQAPSSDNQQIQVSQSNSTRARCDDNTMINFDSVTNISTPRNFSAFTRSSFDLKQVTKFSEDDALPFMDD